MPSVQGAVNNISNFFSRSRLAAVSCSLLHLSVCGGVFREKSSAPRLDAAHAVLWGVRAAAVRPRQTGGIIA